MAGKQRSVHVCQACGHEESRWFGRCPSCSAWNNAVEEIRQKAAPKSARLSVTEDSRPSGVVALADVESSGATTRLTTAIGELDRVLGAGLVPGSVVLLGGDPGIGKSTLALQAAAGVAQGGGRVLYVAGEEAPAQIVLRAQRLGIDSDRIMVLAATEVGAIAAGVTEAQPALVIVDSIQTVYTQRVESAPGSVAQLREAGADLVGVARARDAAILLIGHVTKDGYLAGPRVLEHMVDTVLYFEGERQGAFRILRAVKNRFGPTGEIGVFEMRGGGLAEVSNPSDILIGGRSHAVPGSVIAAAIEGTRPMLVEIQALVAPSNPGTARRTTLGVDHGRVAMLAAVMEKRMGLALVNHDIFVNTAGGVRIDDPGVDLAVVAALASSHLDRPLVERTVVIGEVGLTGEVRAAAQTPARVREAVRLGLTRAVVPAGAEQLLDRSTAGALEVIPVGTVAEAWEAL